MTPLLYALHSGNLYGTERMALATLEGLASGYAPHLFAPPGPVIAEAQRRGIPATPFASGREFALRLMPHVRDAKSFAFVATGVVHSAVCLALAGALRRPVTHVHVVHGGTDERLSYGRKRWLNGRAVRFVAVSNFVRQRLLANGVRASQISVIENFLASSYAQDTPRRQPFGNEGVRRIVVVSRIDPIKRVDLLLDALDAAPELANLEINVYGTGWHLEALRERARKHNPGVTFAGYSADLPRQLAAHDLLVHLCPEEPFGLAVIEAMAAGIPALVPASGGAGAIVEDGVTGFHFRPNDALDLAAQLRRIALAPAAELNNVVAHAHESLRTRFDEASRLADYRTLLSEGH